MANTESLFQALKRRGYECAKGNTAQGSVCIVQSGPSSKFDPPAEIHERFPRYPDNGGFQWRASGGIHSTTLDIDPEALADQVIASISTD